MVYKVVEILDNETKWSNYQEQSFRSWCKQDFTEITGLTIQPFFSTLLNFSAFSQTIFNKTNTSRRICKISERLRELCEQNINFLWLIIISKLDYWVEKC